MHWVNRTSILEDLEGGPAGSGVARVDLSRRANGGGPTALLPFSVPTGGSGSFDADRALRRGPGQWHSRARTHLEKKGCPPSFVDGQIAGIAGAGNLTVVTGNTAEFEPLARLDEGIRVESWFEA